MNTNFKKTKPQVYLAIAAIAFFTVISIQSCEKYVITSEAEYESYSSTIQPIFNKDCTGCHPTVNEPDLTGGSSYDALISGGYVDTDNPESSLIYEKLQGSHSTYTSNTNKEFILQWISEGAKND